MSKTVYYAAKPGSLATMYVTPAARFTIKRRMVPSTLEGSSASYPWVDFYNVKGQKVWECNEQFFDAHFIKCPPEEKPRRGGRRGTTNQNVRGNTRDREARRKWLMKMWESSEGPGTCRCYRCGKLLYEHHVTVDRIIPGAKGGSYRRNNIRPACAKCNSATGAKAKT